MLGGYLQDMVKMSPLQGSYFEIVHDQPRPGLIGAAVGQPGR